MSQETRLVPLPLHTADTAVTVASDLVKEGEGHVKVALLAANAAVDNLGLGGATVRALDADIATAQGVVVGVAVGGLGVEKGHGDGDNWLVGVVGPPASAHGRVPVGSVTSVGSTGVGRSSTRGRGSAGRGSGSRR